MALGTTALLDDFLFRQHQEILNIFGLCGIVPLSRFLEGLFQFPHPLGPGDGRLHCRLYCLLALLIGFKRNFKLTLELFALQPSFC